MRGDTVTESQMSLADLKAQGLSVGQAVRVLEGDGLTRDEARVALAADPAWSTAVEAQDRLFAEVDRLNAVVSRVAKQRDADIPTPAPPAPPTPAVAGAKPAVTPAAKPARPEPAKVTAAPVAPSSPPPSSPPPSLLARWAPLAIDALLLVVAAVAGFATEDGAAGLATGMVLGVALVAIRRIVHALAMRTVFAG